MENLIHQRIVNQQEAVNEISIAMRRARSGISSKKRPMGSFLFLGPTGVGKTQTAKAVNKVFFSNNSLIRFDMSLYQSKSDIPKLIGDSSTNQPGLLTAAIRGYPYGVLLLDELEKADRDLLNIFLTMLDEGYFTDGFGKHIDCKNLIIIATSNAGNDILYQSPTSELIDYLVNHHIFSPEFLNRFDGVIAYHTLDEKALSTIAKKIIDKIAEDILSLYKVKIIVSDDTLQSIISKSYDPRFGARNLERIIRDEIEDKIAKTILEEKTKPGETISL